MAIKSKSLFEKDKIEEARRLRNLEEIVDRKLEKNFNPVEIIVEISNDYGEDVKLINKLKNLYKEAGWEVRFRSRTYETGIRDQTETNYWLIFKPKKSTINK